MTVLELQELLTKAIAEGDGDLPVRVWADHGQYAMSAQCATVDYLYDADDYMGEIIHPDDVDDAQPDVDQKCFVISD